MQRSKLFVLTTLAAVAIALPALAADPSPVGTWKGKVQMDWAKLTAQMPKPKDAKQKADMDKMITQGKESVRKTTLTLTLNGNKTYKVVVNMVPPGGKPTTQTSEGTWSQAGNKITMTNLKENGKPSEKKDTQVMILAAGGKSMTMTNDKMMGAKVTFTR